MGNKTFKLCLTLIFIGSLFLGLVELQFDLQTKFNDLPNKESVIYRNFAYQVKWFSRASHTILVIILILLSYIFIKKLDKIQIDIMRIKSNSDAQDN